MRIFDAASNCFDAGPEVWFASAMVRPREFEEGEVLRLAFDRFRRSGLRGTSLADIARDAGVQRGSLYHAFGSKEALFLTAYARYAEAYLAALGAALAGPGPLRARLQGFFDVAIRNFCAGAPPAGCPTTRALMEIPAAPEPGDEALREAFATLLRRVQALLEAALRAGAARGEFAGDPARAAALLLSVARGLVVLERAFGDEAELRAIAEEAVARVLPPVRG
jgi:AcrR family transcriptional regulator